MGKHAQSIDSQILQRVKASGRGWGFTASNFVDLGSRDAVDKTLTRQSQGGVIRKLARGLYDYLTACERIGCFKSATTCGRKDFTSARSLQANWFLVLRLPKIR